MEKIRWSIEEDQILLRLSKNLTFKEIAKRMSRSYKSVRYRASRLGIKSMYKGYDVWKHPNSERTRFKKGLVPWNKGQIISKVYALQKYRKFCRNLIITDQNQCEICGETKGRFEVHHIEPLDYNSLTVKDLKQLMKITTSNELSVLCHNCHKFLSHLETKHGSIMLRRLKYLIGRGRKK